mmetsp:Transcript_15736/g.37824  ORF Transcript_15736/g.37824 Transcript_15736/m.37824 type:complete len:333 (-) Transcript_15736:57-1055(-)
MLLLPPLSISILLLAHNTRRAFLSSTCATIVAGPPIAFIARADDDGTPSDLYLARPMGIPNANDGSGNVDGGGIPRPSAPPEYLLPAARVGAYIYRTSAIAEDLLVAQSQRGGGVDAAAAADATIRTLENLLLTPPSFVRSSDPTVTRGDPYDNLPPLVGEMAAQQRKQKERKLRSIDVGLTPQLFEVGELMGERRQWNRLVKAERAREDASEVRRALNIYTTNINFNPDRYVYSGSKEEKSRLIRDDKLPSATEVIRSDLDARDLYRNAVQTALDDARAEFVYQRKNGFEDVSELVGLLKDARIAIDRWFGFIPDRDIRDALETVEGEQRS